MYVHEAAQAAEDTGEAADAARELYEQAVRTAAEKHGEDERADETAALYERVEQTARTYALALRVHGQAVRTLDRVLYGPRSD